MNSNSFYAQRLNILLALNQIRSQIIVITRITHELNDPEITDLVVKAKFDKVIRYTEKLSENIREVHPQKSHKPDKAI